MQPPRYDDIESMRERLNKRRNRLLNKFYARPSNTHLAIEIKTIDDRIAKLTEELRAQTRASREGKDFSR